MDFKYILELIHGQYPESIGKMRDEKNNTLLHLLTGDLLLTHVNNLINISDINAQNDDGDTPLHLNFTRNNKTIINALIKNNASVNIPNRATFTVNEYLKYSGHDAWSSKKPIKKTNRLYLVNKIIPFEIYKTFMEYSLRHLDGPRKLFKYINMKKIKTDFGKCDVKYAAKIMFILYLTLTDFDKEISEFDNYLQQLPLITRKCLRLNFTQFTQFTQLTNKTIERRDLSLIYRKPIRARVRTILGVLRAIYHMPWLIVMYILNFIY